MAKLSCAVCGRERNEEDMKILTTTEDERKNMAAMGEESPQERYAYCRGCYQILSNPVTGLSLLKGTVQTYARQSGVNQEVAEKAAENFASKLYAKARKLPQQ